MPIPFAPLMNDVLYGTPSGSYPNTFPNITFSTNLITYMAFDVTVTSVTGGGNIQFFIDRLGASDGVWYNVMSTQTFAGAGVNSWDIGPGFASTAPPNGTAHAVFTTQGRLRVVYTTATSAVFSVSLIGR